MERTTLYIPEELRRSLRAEAKRSGRPQAELVREALRAYLAERDRPQVRSVALGDDEQVTGRDSEAWLEREWEPR